MTDKPVVWRWITKSQKAVWDAWVWLKEEPTWFLGDASVEVEALYSEETVTKLREETSRVVTENTHLRAALAYSKDPCVYCQLPAEEMAKCRSGFPGCDRADDMTGCPEYGASMEAYFLKAQIKEMIPIASAREKRLAEKIVAVAALVEGLRPFARFAGKAERFVDDTARNGGSGIMPPVNDFRLSDFKRASDLVNSHSGDSEPKSETKPASWNEDEWGLR